MRSATFVAFLFGIVGAYSANTTSAPHDLNVRLMTYNVRWATPSPESNEEKWSVRRPHMAAQINAITAGRPESLMCMQEVVEQQLLDLSTDLGSKWAHVGVGRDDGVAAGEFSPIFYRPDAWRLVDNRTYWLSETPDVPGSKGWDAAMARLVTVGNFTHVETGFPFVFMCTHFDDQGSLAQRKSAEFLVNLTQEWESAAGDMTPVFMGGDLNVESDHAAYQILVAEGALHDVRDVTTASRRSGFIHTYTGFNNVNWGNLLWVPFAILTSKLGAWLGFAAQPVVSNLNTNADDMRIDYLFVRNTAAKGVDFLSHAVLPNQFEDGMFISDHRPVVADVSFDLSSSA
ncbi:hypothetical protein Cob_v010571 [Colletotrichum orbiculare MAFF 240422]|uniref:Endonuclease/exonuclease/phosphatase domain-containing protein n=1 Tax=Colletotrichum orbiculare (strain 104-T / ATCC 96160 / CBS 514.97 / LARS 414 / MAFF 240422) TaxID=1213857 RepID=N4VDI5_COLOR|nr:hypothetical protein Cob_v010571 [Colletotrichum orbiculare MAFF 240422]